MKPHFHINDLTFLIRPESTDISIIKEVIERNTYTISSIDNIPDMTIKKGNTVVDIGAHIGSFSILAASKGAMVYSFEPVQESFDLLSENIKLNRLPNITAFHKAVRKEPGVETIYIRDRNFGGSGFYNDPGPLQEEVECTTLPRTHTIDFLKLDCEDSELEILEYNIDFFPYIDKIAVEWVGQERRDAIKALLGDYKLYEKGNEVMGIILAKRK